MRKAKPALIYCMIDPRSGETMYVGKTFNLRQRLAGHIFSPCNESMSSWIKSLLEQGVKPKIELLESVAPGTSWQEREVFWIAEMKRKGASLLNRTDGGGGDINPSEESIMKKEFEAEKNRYFTDIRKTLKHMFGPCEGLGFVQDMVIHELVKRVPKNFRWMFYIENESLFSNKLRRAFKVGIWYYEI
jgi:hypothetical protein